jgi:hypothetical protein
MTRSGIALLIVLGVVGGLIATTFLAGPAPQPPPSTDAGTDLSVVTFHQTA